jgi:hypothetical protein
MYFPECLNRAVCSYGRQITSFPLQVQWSASAQSSGDLRYPNITPPWIFSWNPNAYISGTTTVGGRFMRTLPGSPNAAIYEFPRSGNFETTVTISPNNALPTKRYIPTVTRTCIATDALYIPYLQTQSGDVHTNDTLRVPGGSESHQ